jgi:hypothetical protein
MHIVPPESAHSALYAGLFNEVQSLVKAAGSSIDDFDLLRTQYLRSTPPCNRQAVHMDYNRDADGLSIVIALEGDAAWYVRPRGAEHTHECRLACGVGAALVFRGDVWHAGAEYTEAHLRLHFYAYSSRGGGKSRLDLKFTHVFLPASTLPTGL